MSYDPAIVGYYGKLVETWAADNYPIELDYPGSSAGSSSTRPTRRRSAVGREGIDGEWHSSDVQVLGGSAPDARS